MAYQQHPQQQGYPQQQHQQQYPQQAYHPQQAQYAPQPQHQQVVHHQPQPQQHPPQGYQGHAPMQAHYAQVANPKGWQNSLMDCSPCDSCCLATFLPCVLLGKTSERIRDQTLQTYDTFNSDCLLMCGITYITGCGWIYVMMKRSEIRERFGIDGDGMGDCCVSYWCGCCALIQQDKEVEQRMPPSAPVAQGYQAQGGMVMPSK